MRYIQRNAEGCDLDAYLRYVAERRQDFPAGARDFVAQSWRYDLNDHRCPHDSWLESLTLREVATGDRQQTRSVEIAARFLGTYHDGTFDLTYEGVTDYALAFAKPAKRPNVAHGDWIVDEVTLNEAGAVVHEIQFEGGVWSIVCADVRHRWHPMAR
jgi:hypothetical protein